MISNNSRVMKINVLNYNLRFRPVRIGWCLPNNDWVSYQEILNKRTAPQYEIGNPETGIVAYAVLMPHDKDHTLLLELEVAVQWGNLDLNQGPTGYESIDK